MDYFIIYVMMLLYNCKSLLSTLARAVELAFSTSNLA